MCGPLRAVGVAHVVRTSADRAFAWPGIAHVVRSASLRWRSLASCFCDLASSFGTCGSPEFLPSLRRSARARCCPPSHPVAPCCLSSRRCPLRRAAASRSSSSTVVSSPLAELGLSSSPGRNGQVGQGIGDQVAVVRICQVLLHFNNSFVDLASKSRLPGPSTSCSWAIRGYQPLVARHLPGLPLRRSRLAIPDHLRNKWH